MVSNNASFLTDELMKGTDWRAMERNVARLMSHCGWMNVRIIGRRGDGGGDILATRLENGIEKVFVVQVKCVIGSKYVGPNALQEAIDALPLYGGDVAVVATNGEFTESMRKRVNELRGYGFDCRIWNGMFLQQIIKNWPVEHWEKRKPRPYQQTVIEDAKRKVQQGGRAVQFIVATGLGKSTIAAEIVNDLKANGMSRVLVLCHSQDLSLQLDQSFWPQILKDTPTHVFFDGIPPKNFDGINFGTYQTLAGFLAGIEPDTFDVVVIDEAHHALANGFLRCLNHLRPKVLIGMTATPWRGDGQTLDSIFGGPIAEISLVDGMKLGYLAKVNYRIFCDTIDWDIVKVHEKKLSIKDLNKKLFVPQRDEAIVSEVLRFASNVSDPRIIFFCSSIEHCNRISDLVNLSGLKCSSLSGINKVDRFRALMEFSTGRIQAVTAVDVINEGIDVPDVNIIAFLRVTHSRRIFVQQLGRGLRISKNKTEVTILDFVTDIRRLADIIGMDKEARSERFNSFTDVYFPDGLIQFDSSGIIPFVEEWLRDVTSIESSDEKSKLVFPPEV